MPDMGRVEATNGTVGYMAIDDIEVAVFNGAKLRLNRPKLPSKMRAMKQKRSEQPLLNITVLMR